MKRVLLFVGSFIAGSIVSLVAVQAAVKTLPHLIGKWGILYVASGEIDHYTITSQKGGKLTGYYQMENGPRLPLVGSVDRSGHVTLDLVIHGTMNKNGWIMSDTPLSASKREH